MLENYLVVRYPEPAGQIVPMDFDDRNGTSPPEPTPSYRLRQVRLDEDLSAIASDWRKCNAKFQNDTIFCDPEWLREFQKGNLANVRIMLFEKESEIVGAVPFAFITTPLRCQIGDLTAATFQLRRLHLFGCSPSIPSVQAAYDRLFTQFSDLANAYDVIFMEGAKVDSFFWTYLHSSLLVKKHFRLYCPHGPVPHTFIRMKGSFGEYMQKFSSKTRKNRLREIRRLREKGNVELLRVTDTSQVDRFVDTAAEISRKTYQFNLLGAGIRDPSTWKEKLEFAARHGWLRSYLLKCGGIPCCFVVGYQFREVYYHYNIGHDPAWSELSVGTVLQLLVLEDLFSQNTPEIYDLGGYVAYKNYFATESYTEAMVFLFARRPYPLMVERVYRACTITSKEIGALLERLNLKSRIRHLIRL
jgi:hypothetical protein